MTLRGVLKLDAVVTDTTLTKARVDPVMPDQGMLVLVDLAHPNNPDTYPAQSATPSAIVPSNGAALYNIAWKQAAAMVGSGDATSRAVALSRGAYGANGILERSAKGGLHSVAKKASDPGTGYYAHLVDAAVTTWLRDYIYANPTHLYYTGSWCKVTRAGTLQQTTTYNLISSVTTATSNYLGFVSNGSGAPSGGDVPATSASGPVFASAKANGWVGTPAGAASSVRVILGAGGNEATLAYDATRRQASADKIVYRTCLEDLTVSGRTWQQARDADYAQFLEDLTKATGRFYNDTTPTDPATYA